MVARVEDKEGARASFADGRLEAARAHVLREIAAVQSVFPPGLVRALALEPIDARALDGVLARATKVFPPTCLPLYTTGDRILAVHVCPGLPWRDSAFYELASGDAELRLVASNLRALPSCLVLPPMAHGAALDEAWDHAVAFAHRIPGATLPVRQDADADSVVARAEADPWDALARAAAACLDRPRDDVRRRAREIAAELADDTHGLALLALASAEVDPDQAAALAARVVHREVPHGFARGIEGLTPRAATGPELLELLRAHAMQRIEPRDALHAMHDAPFAQASAADVLRGVSAWYAEAGAARDAFNQVRNAAYVAGAYGGGVSPDLCVELAARASALAGGLLASDLALLAGASVTEAGGWTPREHFALSGRHAGVWSRGGRHDRR